MNVCRSVRDVRAAVRRARRPLGLVPTMGALHDGHLALVAAARGRCATVAASLFVNPTQFGRGEDYERYPRDEARDLALFEEAGVDLVFAPAVGEMYPQGFATTVHVDGALSATLEGAARPGHFDGVATVVVKLLDIVQPDLAFFGQKDAQQLALVRRVVRDLDLAVEVVAVPTVREPDGLAMSSRNAYLTKEQRAVAPRFYQALLAGRAAANGPSPDRGPVTPEVVVATVRAALEASGAFAIDYVAVVDADTFAPEREIGERSLLVAAVRLGDTRLIDNIPLAPDPHDAGAVRPRRATARPRRSPARTPAGDATGRKGGNP